MAHSRSFNITNEDLNKFKVCHTLNTVGQSILLEVYQHYKQFDDSKNIKDHLIQDRNIPEPKFKKLFTKPQQDKITKTDNSGKDYDISLLIDCLRVLSRNYDPGDSESKWMDELELEGRCKKLKDKRNDVFHSFLGISDTDMRSEIQEIESIVMDIIFSLEGRFPDKISKMIQIKKDIKDDISNIILQPLGKSYIKTYLKEKTTKLLNDEKALYKERCKEWGQLKMIDFLLGCKTFHNVKVLFTDVVVENSIKFKQNTPIKCKDILTMASSSSIILINSESGGGKTTVFRYGVNDYGEGTNDMNTSQYDYIFPMLFRNSDICSLKDLIADLIPNVSNNIDMEYIMEGITEPSQNVLFFCDGYDEKNEKSLQLFSEICKLKKKYPHISIVVTCRPEFVRLFYETVGTEHSIEHLKVLGIDESNRSAFLKKYHDELIANDLSKQCSDDLLHFYESCSARHKELYRIPLHLVILAWLWGVDPEKAKRIRSAAGLYSEITNILNIRLRRRILELHPDIISRLGDLDALVEFIDEFKELVYNESLVAVRHERMYLDTNSVNKLKNFCKKERSLFPHLKGAYLLSKLEWENKENLKEILEVPHKGFLDFYSAKCLESKLQHKNSVKEIIFDIDTYGDDCDKIDLYKYQNILQLLGGILALNDSNLVEKHGQDIINLLIKSGVNDNSKWYDIFSDFNLNPTAANKFGSLIAPHLDLNKLLIKDADVDILSTLLKYINNIDNVSLDINRTTKLGQLPVLIDILRTNQCHVKISNIGDTQVNLWNSSIRQNSKISIDKVEIKHEQSLPFLEYCEKIKYCRLQPLWREACHTAPNMSGCKIWQLHTAVTTTESLPTNLRRLFLGLWVDPATGRYRDPGLVRFIQRCKQLHTLAVHVRAGIETEDLPRLPDVRYTWLYISQLCNNGDLQRAVDTARHLQPPRGYTGLVLPSCSLHEQDFYKMIGQLAAVGVVVDKVVAVSSSNWGHNRKQLEDATRDAFNCKLFWYKDDDELSSVTDW